MTSLLRYTERLFVRNTYPLGIVSGRVDFFMKNFFLSNPVLLDACAFVESGCPPLASF